MADVTTPFQTSIIDALEAFVAPTNRAQHLVIIAPKRMGTTFALLWWLTTSINENLPKDIKYHGYTNSSERASIEAIARDRIVSTNWSRPGRGCIYQTIVRNHHVRIAEECERTIVMSRWENARVVGAPQLMMKGLSPFISKLLIFDGLPGEAQALSRFVPTWPTYSGNILLSTSGNGDDIVEIDSREHVRQMSELHALVGGKTISVLRCLQNDTRSVHVEPSDLISVHQVSIEESLVPGIERLALENTEDAERPKWKTPADWSWLWK